MSNKLYLIKAEVSTVSNVTTTFSMYSAPATVRNSLFVIKKTVENASTGVTDIFYLETNKADADTAWAIKDSAVSQVLSTSYDFPY